MAGWLAENKPDGLLVLGQPRLLAVGCWETRIGLRIWRSLLGDRADSHKQ
jgi:hypothetical protein